MWQLWADPRKLERWWGPPTYPATVVEHDLHRGGKVHYFMTEPRGRASPRLVGSGRRSTNRIASISWTVSPTTTVIPNDDMPITKFTVTFTELASGGDAHGHRVALPVARTRCEQMIEMGMEEGMSEAIGQIAAILAEG